MFCWFTTIKRKMAEILTFSRKSHHLHWNTLLKIHFFSNNKPMTFVLLSVHGFHSMTWYASVSASK